MKTDSLEILRILASEIKSPKSELVFDNPYQLLCAVILSAQCTDKRVNQVTPTLFQYAPDVFAMANADVKKVEEIIHSCGFYHNKAQFLVQSSKDVVDRFGGVVPNNLEDLQSLKGVGGKTANVVYAVGFGGQAIAVDTHVFRVSNRLGLTDAKNVLQTEKQLMQVIPKEMWADAHHYILLHGRYVCKSQKPMCHACKLCHLCKYFKGKAK